MSKRNFSYTEYLENLIVGAAFLGSGGGGPLPLARKLADYMRSHHLIPPVIPFSNANPNGFVGSGTTLHIVGVRANDALLTPAVLDAYAAVLQQLGYAGTYQPLSYE